jgi:hypothetical protein
MVTRRSTLHNDVLRLSIKTLYTNSLRRLTLLCNGVEFLRALLAEPGESLNKRRRETQHATVFKIEARDAQHAVIHEQMYRAEAA